MAFRVWESDLGSMNLSEWLSARVDRMKFTTTGAPDFSDRYTRKIANRLNRVVWGAVVGQPPPCGMFDKTYEQGHR